MQITFMTELILIFVVVLSENRIFFIVRLKKFNCKVINIELLLIKSGDGDLG